MSSTLLKTRFFTTVNNAVNVHLGLVVVSVVMVHKYVHFLSYCSIVTCYFLEKSPSFTAPLHRIYVQT